MPLRNQKATSFLATASPAESRIYYEQMIGLDLIEETDFALVFSIGDSQLRIQKVKQVSPPPYTSMGWQVDDIEHVVGVLTDRGVTFEQYDRFVQDDRGIWTSPSGARVSWFRDPDGNTLSLTQP